MATIINENNNCRARIVISREIICVAQMGGFVSHSLVRPDDNGTRSRKDSSTVRGVGRGRSRMHVAHGRPPRDANAHTRSALRRALVYSLRHEEPRECVVSRRVFERAARTVQISGRHEGSCTTGNNMTLR